MSPDSAPAPSRAERLVVACGPGDDDLATPGAPLADIHIDLPVDGECDDADALVELPMDDDADTGDTLRMPL